MVETEEQKNRRLRKQKGYIDTIADLEFIKNSIVMQIYDKFCRKHLWSQRASEALAKKEFIK